MKHVIGIDIGGTSTKLGIVSWEDASILRSESIRTDCSSGAKAMVDHISEVVVRLVGNSSLNVLGVGVGCPGLIDQHTGSVLKSPNLPLLNGFPLREALSQRLQLPIEVENDANAAVLGEFWFGSSKGVQDLVLLTLGTGVGGGVISGGKLLHGANQAAGELGHLKVEPSGELCSCGKKGCLEAYVGAAGIVRIARCHLSRASSSQVVTDMLNTKTITEAAEAEDFVAREILKKVGYYLGRGIEMLIEILDPQKVVLAGRASASIEFLRPGINAALDGCASFAYTRNRIQIDRVTCPEKINLIGAAASFFDAVVGK